MALQKQTLAVQFQKGVDNADDGKLVISSRFTKLDNLEWRGKNTIRQRPGFTKQPLTPRTGSPAIVDCKRLLALGAEVLLESSAGLSAFVELGTTSRNMLSTTNSIGGAEFERLAQTSLDTIVAADSTTHETDAAAIDGWECWAYGRAEPGGTTHVYVKVLNVTSREELFEQEVNPAAASASGCRVLAYTQAGVSYFRVYWFDGADVQVASSSWTPVTGMPSAFGSNNIAAVTAIAAFPFDCYYDATNGNVIIAYSPVGAGVKVQVTSGTDGFTAIRSSAVYDAALAVSNISVVVGRLGGISYGLVLWATSVAQNVRIASVTLSTAATAAGPSTVGTQGGGNTTFYMRLAVAPSFLSGYAVVVYDTNPSTRIIPGLGAGSGTLDPFNCDVNIAYYTYAGAFVGAGIPAVFAKGVKLMARPTLYSNGSVPNLAITCGTYSNFQPTVFVLKEGSAGNLGDRAGCPGSGHLGPQVLARVLPALAGALGIAAGTLLGNKRLSTGIDNNLSQIQLPVLKLGAIGDPQSVARVVLSPVDPLPAVPASDSLLLAGACPQIYDGVRAHEAGFNLYPDDLYFDQSTVGGAGSRLTELATYSLLGVYEWRDNKGRLWRSAAGVPTSVTLTGTHNVITVSFPYLRLTAKQTIGSLTNSYQPDSVTLVVYHTEGNGNIYYRGATADNSDQALGDAQINISETDAVLISHALLYTTGGGLDNEAWPSTNVVCTHQRRVFLAIPGAVQYTDEADDDRLAPATSDVYQIPVPTEGGKITGLGSMDEKLVIFCERQIYFVYGQGPNRLGQQNNYSLPELCCGLMGCALGCAESVILSANEGLWFMSSSGGLRLLTRGLEIAKMTETAPDDNEAFLGAEVDDFFSAGYTTVRALAINGRSQIRFYVSGTSSCVIWDFQQKQWSRLTNHTSAGGACVARGVFWHSDGTNLYSSNTTVAGLDDTTVTPQVLESAWFSLAGVQGFQRVYQLMLLGQALSACTVQVEVGYDFNLTWITTALASTANVTPDGGALLILSGFIPTGATIRGLTSGATATVTSGNTAGGDAGYTNLVGVFVTEIVEVSPAFIYNVAGAMDPLQIAHPMTRQKCESMRFRLTITPGSAAEGVRLTGFALSVGLKPGLNRLPPGQRF